MADTPILSVTGLTRKFVQSTPVSTQIASLITQRRWAPEKAVRAVNDVSFDIAAGETLGLVGESGCGKSTVARLVAGLLTPTSGEILFKGKPLQSCSQKELLKIQMVFQDPLSSLNPRMRLAQQLTEAITVHGIVSRSEQETYLRGIFGDCGIDPVLANRYPHQVSGGQRQRFGIARALAMQPDLILCDEPVAALDVSIQAQIVNLFAKLRRDRGLAYLFISHDLNVVRHLCDETIVMYLGRVVERGPSTAIMSNPRHRYTDDLRMAAPRVSATKRNFSPVHGEIPSPLSPPSGCAYHTRCRFVDARCKTDMPPVSTTSTGAFTCHNPILPT